MTSPLFLIFAGILITFVSVAATNTSSVAAIDINGPLQLEASYVGDFYGNLSGGIKTGFGFLGMANLKIGFDTEKANWWKGGSFFINGASTHGKSPTENFTGDFQVVSNIDAGDLIYLHELWFKQTVSSLEFTIGLQDLNKQFAASDNGSYYLNSSFGIPPVISSNVPVPIFPLTGLGVSVGWAITDKISWLAAIFDGSPTDFDENPYNLNWDINKNDGLLAISELQVAGSIGGEEGKYKAGAYYHTKMLEKSSEGLSAEVFDRNYGFYALADQTIWKGGHNRRIEFFAQLAWSPGNLNTHNLYMGGGFNCYGLLKGDHENTLGIAVASAGFHRGFHKHENTIETFFNYQVNKCISVQPDFQYIISPAGTDVKLENAMIGFVRVGIQF